MSTWQKKISAYPYIAGKCKIEPQRETMSYPP